MQELSIQIPTLSTYHAGLPEKLELAEAKKEILRLRKNAANWKSKYNKLYNKTKPVKVAKSKATQTLNEWRYKNGI